MTRRRLTFSTTVLLAALTVAVRAQQLADERSRREAVQYYRNGQEFMAAERFERASEEFTRAVKKDPLFTLAHYSLGHAYMNQRRYVSAIQAFRSALESARNLYHLSETHAFEVERLRDDEIRELKDTIRRMQQQGGTRLRVLQLQQRLDTLENQRPSLRSPFTPPAEVLLSLGSAQFKNGDPVGAETQWKAAVEANPKLGEAHNNLAVIYMQTGRYKEAEDELKAAEKSGVRVNPQFKDDLKKARDRR
jgi:Tfp pilus assembly protein PilF